MAITSPNTPSGVAATGLPRHLSDHEDDVRSLPELVFAAMQLSETDDTNEGRALHRVIAVAYDRAVVVLAMWEAAVAGRSQ